MIDPAVSAKFVFPAATFAGGAEAVLTWMEDASPAQGLLAVIAAAAGAAWVMLAITLSTRLLNGASRGDVRRTLRLQASQHDFNDAVWRLLSRDAAALRFLHVDHALVAAEQDLVVAAHAVENAGDVVAVLPRWHAVRARWYAVAATALPDLSDAEPTPDELRAARDRLPPGRNLASADLRAMIAYLAQATRLAGDRTRLHAARDAALGQLGVDLPPVAEH